MWNKKTYTEPRPQHAFDDMYDIQVKTRAFVNYGQRTAQFAASVQHRSDTLPMRGDSSYTTISEEKHYIQLVTRRPNPGTDRGMYRVVSNIHEVHAKLISTFGQAVNPKLFDFDMFAFSVNATVELLRGTRILIAPHGAGLANIVYMPPGSGVIEMAVRGHKKHPMMYKTIAEASSVLYQASYCKGSQWGDSPIIANSGEIVSLVKAMLLETTAELRVAAREHVNDLLKTYSPPQEPQDMSCHLESH